MVRIFSTKPALPHIGGHLISIQRVGLGDTVQARLKIIPDYSTRLIGVLGAVITVASRSDSFQPYTGALQELRLIGGVPHNHSDRGGPIVTRPVIPIRVGRDGEGAHREHSDQHDRSEQASQPLIDQLCHCWIYLLFLPKCSYLGLIVRGRY